MRIGRGLSVVAIVLMATVPVAVTTLWTVRFMKDLLESLALQRGRELAQMLSNSVDSLASQTGFLVMSAAHHPGVIALLRAAAAGDKTSTARIVGELQPALAGPFTADSPLEQVRIIDATGREWLRIRKGPRGPEPVPDAQLGDAFAKVVFESVKTLTHPGVFVPDPVTREKLESVEKTAEPMIRCVSPVIEETDGKRLGLVCITFRRDAFFAPMEELSHSYRGHIYVVNSTGTVLFPHESRENFGALLDRMQSEQNALIPWKDEYFLPTMHELGATWQGERWRILFSFPRSDLTAQIADFRRTALGLVSITALLAMTVAMLLTAPATLRQSATPPPP